MNIHSNDALNVPVIKLTGSHIQVEECYADSLDLSLDNMLEFQIKWIYNMDRFIRIFFFFFGQPLMKFNHQMPHLL